MKETESLQTTRSRSFYVRGNSEEISEKLARHCSNATDIGSRKLLDLDDDRTKEALRGFKMPYEIKKVFAIKTTYKSKEVTELVDVVGCTSFLRALVVEYEGLRQVEVIPFHFLFNCPNCPVRKDNIERLGLEAIY